MYFDDTVERWALDTSLISMLFVLFLLFVLGIKLNRLILCVKMSFTYIKEGEHGKCHPSEKDDSNDSDEADGGEEHLTYVTHGVADSQGKGQGATKAREPEHVLKLKEGVC